MEWVNDIRQLLNLNMIHTFVYKNKHASVSFGKRHIFKLVILRPLLFIPFH